MTKKVCALLAAVLLLQSAAFAAAAWSPSAQAGSNSLRLYDDNRVVAYVAVKYVYDATLANVDLQGYASPGDNIYSIYEADGSRELVSFISSTAKFRGLAKGDAAGVLRPLFMSGQNKWVISGSNAEGISQTQLKTIMDFFNFSFDNNNPVLDKHIEARAGGWVVIEAGQKPKAKPVYRLAPPAVITKP